MFDKGNAYHSVLKEKNNKNPYYKVYESTWWNNLSNKSYLKSFELFTKKNFPIYKKIKLISLFYLFIY